MPPDSTDSLMRNGIGVKDKDKPRWTDFAQPRVPGFASYEWNVLEGCTWYSPEWESMTQYEYDNEARHPQEWWMDKVPPEDMNTIYRSCLAMHAGFTEEGQVVFRFRRADGALRVFANKGRVTHWTKDGAPAVVSGVCMDMTDILADNPSLKVAPSLSELDVLSMLENSPDLFIRFDKRLNPVYVNPMVNRYLGGMNKEPGKEHRLAGNYKELFRTHVDRVFSEKAVVREQLRLAMSDGSEVLGDASFWPEFGADGAVRYAMVQFRDVSAEHQLAERISLNEQRFKALYQLTLLDATDEAQILQYVMDSMLALFKSPRGFIFLPEDEDGNKGQMFWSADHYQEFGEEFLPHNFLPKDILIQMTDEKGNCVPRGLNNNMGDEPLYVVFGGAMSVRRGIIASVTEGKRTVCIAGVCNKDSDYEESDLQQLETFLNSAWLIVRRRRFVRELQIAKEAAEAANNAKNAFLANVSHELRTPMNGVLSMLQLIENLPMDDEQRGYLLNAQASGQALLRIISDILDFSGMEAGKMRLALEPFDCRAIVRSTLTMFARDAAGKGLDFTWSVEDSIPPRLLGDADRLRQILYNVVGNALKFTPKGKVDVSLRLLEDSPPEKVGLRLEVADTGIGIPANMLGKVFDAFMRVSNSHRRQYTGTGLGLGIVRHLSALMDGTASVQSEQGKGSCVRCDLFFSLPESENLPLPVASLPAPAQTRQQLDILVAEDDSVGRVAIRAFLERAGHRVFCVEDGAQALEALQLHNFDCLFTDISMPHIDGMELLQRIRQGKTDGVKPTQAMRKKMAAFAPDAPLRKRSLNPSLCVVAVSAHAMIGDKDTFLSAGMDYYISKPIAKKELDATLAAIRARMDKHV